MKYTYCLVVDIKPKETNSSLIPRALLDSEFPLNLTLRSFWQEWHNPCPFTVITHHTIPQKSHLVQMKAPLDIQFSSVTQSCPTLCNPMNSSTPDLPVHHQLPEFTQTHVHWVSDAIQPSHPLSSPSPPAPNPSQHQSLFQWVNSSHEVAKVLESKL